VALDLEAFPAAVRATQIRLGEQFGSQDTLDQANQTLTGYAAYGAALAGAGFVAPDAERLTEARDLLMDAGVGRETARGQKKVTPAEGDRYPFGARERPRRDSGEGVHSTGNNVLRAQHDRGSAGCERARSRHR
jgi:hypothetical protein